MTHNFEKTYIRYNELPSTNEEMKQVLGRHQLDEGIIITTSHQVAGKGQAGNTWESEKGKNLTFSLLLRPDFLEPHKQFYISKIVSLGLIDTIREFLCGITIKWPNDIYIGDKKLAGILIENSILGPHLDYCIIGIGLNVNQTNFVSDAPNPVSLKGISMTDFDLDELLDKIINHIQKRYNQLKQGMEKDIDHEYFSLLYRNIGKHPFKDENGYFRASIKSVNEMGLLTLKDEEGSLREYAFKEVEFVQE
ncbi:biotin--[acetyl-CoA-carboxylase] ligase [Carboxylicivirga linearis]|uniref:Biotin--[acetyl-CoA-carboxylase] ligase n=1 Tax=Carboxylicivirga linearis TaxID=1628157 RepID=A0ABS5JQ46_9BACT|nr:biotin--[acetyl-CoA-carboxylase] ligase [Carboxylicivirga linearis]MBS2096882.1 biotin--[acetyl-CoA-carboxylase] ligase [Carboxylicivirga linearis]